MRPAPWTIPVASLLLASCASVHDRDRDFVQRTPLPRVPPPNTLDRAGGSADVARWAVPGVSRYEAGGYVGGGSIKTNVPLRRRTDEVGAPGDGTFGLDFVGFRSRPGRVFLAPSPDPAAGAAIADNYKTDGPHVPDIFNIRPLRKAVLEKREAAEERRGGGEHGGEQGGGAGEHGAGGTEAGGSGHQ